MKTSSHVTPADSHALKCELASEVLRSSGRLRLQVTGSSMLPTVCPGDTLVIERADHDAIAERDIVLFSRDGRFVVHRVVRKDSGDSTIQTRGDAMSQPDPSVRERDLLGKVSLIIRNGKCIEPKRDLSLSQRTVAALVRRSDIAARAVVKVHSMRLMSPAQTSLRPTSLGQTSPRRTALRQTLLRQTSNDRAVPCQS
jgi:signal peptidase I